MPDVYAIILAGGSGTRFWPASRRATPKQFLSIVPGTSETLVSATLRRLAPLVAKERVLVATGAHLIDAARRSLPELAGDAFLAEPVARNTAPCIGWATAQIARRDPEAVVMVLPSDHFIAGDDPRFLDAMQRALRSAGTSAISTIGLKPTRAETGYGYIETGAELEPGIHRVARFVEKPDLATAEDYQRGGKHLWNSGMFFFRAQQMLEAIGRHLPELYSGLMRIERASRLGPVEEDRETRAVFEAITGVSIDYGVMEKETPLNVVVGDFAWNDLGSWQSAWELADKDQDDNTANPGTVLVDARGNLVRDLRTDGKRRVLALVGVQDLCVIETDDALLVIPRARSQEARRAVERLLAQGAADWT